MNDTLPSFGATLAAAIAVFVAGMALSHRAERRRKLSAGAAGSRPHGRRRRRVGVEVAAAEWCERAARLLRSGSSLARAVIDASDDSSTPPAVRRIADAVGRGSGLRDAIDTGGGTGPGIDVGSPTGLILTVLRTAAELGGPAAPALERTAGTLRTRAAIGDEIAAQSAQARLSAVVLTLLPLAVLALLLAVEPDVRAELAAPRGLLVVGTGSLLNLVGWLWMRQLTTARST